MKHDKTVWARAVRWGALIVGGLAWSACSGNAETIGGPSNDAGGDTANSVTSTTGTVTTSTSSTTSHTTTSTTSETTTESDAAVTTLAIYSAMGADADIYWGCPGFNGSDLRYQPGDTVTLVVPTDTAGSYLGYTCICGSNDEWAPPAGSTEPASVCTP